MKTKLLYLNFAMCYNYFNKLEFGGENNYMNTHLKIYSDNYKSEMINRIAKFFGFHVGLSDKTLVDKIDENISIQNLNNWLSKDNELYMIMYENDVIGFLRIGYRGGNVAWLEDIFVDEEYRNKGVATESIRQAEIIVSNKPPYNAMCIDIVPRNIEALKLYFKLGYDTLSMVTIRKNFVDKESDGVQNFRGLDFKF